MQKRELPEGWEWKRLEDVCKKPEYGYTTSAKIMGNGPKFLRTTDITRLGFDWKDVPFCEQIPEDEERYQLHNGDILISRAGSVGAAFVVKNPPRAIFASYLIRFQPKEELNPFYACFFLKSNIFKKQLAGSTSGTTLQGINASNLAKIKLPLPPLPVQRSIVEILEQADTLRHLRAQADAETQKLLQSVFYEMFGDPVRNEKGWETRSFDEIALIKDVDHRMPPGVEKGVPLISPKNFIANDKIDFNNSKKISYEEYTKMCRKIKPQVGDIIFSRYGTICESRLVPNDKKFQISGSVEIIFPKERCP